MLAAYTACLVCLKATTNTLPEESKKAILPFINCLDQTLLNERHHQEEILSSYSGSSYQTDINKMPELSPGFANNAIPVPWSKPQEKKRDFWNSTIEAAEEIAMKNNGYPPCR